MTIVLNYLSIEMDKIEFCLLCFLTYQIFSTFNIFPLALFSFKYRKIQGYINNRFALILREKKHQKPVA